jgi:plasmid stability protein
MASITLKNVPDELLKALRRAAKSDRRSLNQEVMHLLGLALGTERAPVRAAPDVEAQVSAWQSIARRWKSDLTAEEEARSVVATRSRGRKVDL